MCEVMRAPFWPERLLGDLNDDFLAVLQQIGDGGRGRVRPSSRTLFDCFGLRFSLDVVGSGAAAALALPVVRASATVALRRWPCWLKRPPRRRRMRRDMRCM